MAQVEVTPEQDPMDIIAVDSADQQEQEQRDQFGFTPEETAKLAAEHIQHVADTEIDEKRLRQRWIGGASSWTRCPATARCTMCWSMPAMSARRWPKLMARPWRQAYRHTSYV